MSNDAKDQELSNRIGQSIRDRRKQMGMSQAALAESVDLAQQSIFKIEHGISTPGLHRLAAIAKTLNLPVSELLDGIKPKRSLSVSTESLTGMEAELISVFRQFPDIQGKRALLQVARRMCSAASVQQPKG